MTHKFCIDSNFIDYLIKVSSELHLTMTIDELLAMFVEVFESLLPGRHLSFRLVKTDSDSLEFVYANGRLKDGQRDVFFITDGALEGHTLSDDQLAHILEQGKIERNASYQCIFDDGVAGFNFLLFDRQYLYGSIDVEYNTPPENLEGDRVRVLPFVHLFVAALRNTRMMSETLMLKEYREKLLDNANAPVVAVNREGEIVLLNKAFERITGMPRNKVLGTSLFSWIPPSSRRGINTQVKRAIRGETVNNIEMKFIDADDIDEGITAHIAFNSAPIHNSFGQLESVIFVGQDVTQIRTLQRQIIHSEKLATLGQVAAGVAHELNNPLTSISVYGAYLRKNLNGKIADSDLRKLDNIVDGAERIQSFTRDLVSYARPSADTPELVNLSAVISRAVSFCEHVISDACATLTIDQPETAPFFYGVGDQLEQVFVNLITNACHALACRGSILITIKPMEDDLTVISIRDDGIGIPPPRLKRIFDPFYTNKEVGKGTGLGLSIVRNILDSHNIGISVDSQEGVGTVFVLTFRTRRSK